MPLFFFHLRDGSDVNEDSEGIELDDVDSARTEAITAACEMLAEQITLGIPIGDQIFEVCDEGGVMVFKLAFKDVLHS